MGSCARRRVRSQARARSKLLVKRIGPSLTNLTRILCIGGLYHRERPGQGAAVKKLARRTRLLSLSRFPSAA